MLETEALESGAWEPGDWGNRKRPEGGETCNQLATHHPNEEEVGGSTIGAAMNTPTPFPAVSVLDLATQTSIRRIGPSV
jgi:hypothetical protein